MWAFSAAVYIFEYIPLNHTQLTVVFTEQGRAFSRCLVARFFVSISVCVGLPNDSNVCSIMFMFIVVRLFLLPPKNFDELFMQ